MDTSNISETTRIQTDVFAIRVTFKTTDRVKGEWIPKTHSAYFKADRYSCYSGRLQTEWDIECARHYKTAANAQAALGRLMAKQTIQAKYEPCIVRFTKSIVERYETIVAEL